MIFPENLSGDFEIVYESIGAKAVDEAPDIGWRDRKRRRRTIKSNCQQGTIFAGTIPICVGSVGGGDVCQQLIINIFVI